MRWLVFMLWPNHVACPKVVGAVAHAQVSLFAVLLCGLVPLTYCGFGIKSEA